MKPFGKIFPLTISEEDLVIPFLPFLVKELAFVGSCASTPDSVEQMLKFAAEKGIKPVLEEFDMTVEGINAALKRLGDGKMRYRGVLVV